ncbi:MAG: hypothetical protein JWR14_6000, partial [Caballeronia sp.]|nr:hypothetical protein [Caballeronia sp.]
AQVWDGKQVLKRALQISFRLRESVTQTIIPEIAMRGGSVNLAEFT